MGGKREGDRKARRRGRRDADGTLTHTHGHGDAAPHSATVADTKKTFLELYPRPMPAMYQTVTLELLVQQHLQRYNAAYHYNALYALGITSVFDQVLESYEDKDGMLKAYFESLQESEATFRKDAEAMEAWASGLASADEVKCDASGSEGQKVMAEVAAKVAEDKFLYTNFLAVGIFRVLELAQCTDPAALERVVNELGLKKDAVTRDLATYKGILSKLNAAKELMKEYLERERKQTAARLEAKAAKDEGSAPPSAQETPTAPATEVASETSA